MDEIFGREVENMEELNEIPNGLMLSTYAEKRLEDGDIVLVPDVTDAASQEEIDAWSKSEPKEYKSRVANPEAKDMNWLHPGDVSPRRSWNELDGRKVQFSSDHRPSSAVSLLAVLQNNAKTLVGRKKPSRPRTYYCRNGRRSSGAQKALTSRDECCSHLWSS